jgi:hypothetical protein
MTEATAMEREDDHKSRRSVDRTDRRIFWAFLLGAAILLFGFTNAWLMRDLTVSTADEVLERIADDCDKAGVLRIKGRVYDCRRRIAESE